ncbi:AAA family ATPase [Candidatus Woesearchaeota archaeon]|nr:AAA family ATPase [Candidatus Woesearchaeota archaeon]
MKIIAITGMPGSGKKIIRQEIEKKGIPVFVMRHVVEDDLRAKGVEPTNTSLREYATKLRKEHGLDIVAKRSLEIVRKMGVHVVVLDGIRGDAEIHFLKSQPDIDFILIAAIASKETRFERLKQRGLEWDMKTKEEFEYREKKELGWGLGAAIELADYKIENEGTVEEFRKNIEKVLKKIL